MVEEWEWFKEGALWSPEPVVCRGPFPSLLAALRDAHGRATWRRYSECPDGCDNDDVRLCTREHEWAWECVLAGKRTRIIPHENVSLDLDDIVGEIELEVQNTADHVKGVGVRVVGDRGEASAALNKAVAAWAEKFLGPVGHVWEHRGFEVRVERDGVAFIQCHVCREKDPGCVECRGAGGRTVRLFPHPVTAEGGEGG